MEAWVRVFARFRVFASKRFRPACASPKIVGTFADAERPGPSRRPTTHGTTAPSSAPCSCRSYSQLGRVDEAKRLVEARWEHLNATGEGASEQAIVQLQLHLILTLKPNPVRNIGSYLDNVLKRAPDDDRVWLGRANLAIRSGEYGEAKRWLDACLKRTA